jgi:hypothetical protein
MRGAAMKKAAKVFSILILVVLMAASAIWADEASVFDGANGWLLRTYSTGAGPYEVYFEVVDASNQLVSSNLVLQFNGDTVTNPFLVNGSSPSPDVSLSYDGSTGTAYVFTDGGSSPTLNTIGVAKAGPNLSVSPTSLSFSAVAGGAPKTSPVTVSNTGNADLSSLSIGAITGSSDFTRTTTCGATLAPGASCSVDVTYASVSAGSDTGSFIISSSDKDVTVDLSGTATTSGSNIDLQMTSLVTPGTISNGSIWPDSTKTDSYLSMTVKNNGTTAAGQFNVKVYISKNGNTFDGADILVYTWTVSSLAGGQSQTHQFKITAPTQMAVHSIVYAIAVADPENAIAETNENNNAIAGRDVTVNR